jgi:hypothetical protein
MGHPVFGGGWRRTGNGKAEADLYGMTTITAKATARARTTAKTRANAGSFGFAQDRLFDCVTRKVRELLRSDDTLFV